MKWGYLYCSMNPKTTFDAKAAEACVWYTKKFGRMPEICIVHPDDVGKLTITPPDKITIDQHQLTVMSWERMVKDFIGLCCQGEETNQPVTDSPKDSAVVNAFIKHAQQVRA
jgi:hypothetical protein